MEKRIRKAIIPAAGLGTRFLPATKVRIPGANFLMRIPLYCVLWTGFSIWQQSS